MKTTLRIAIAAAVAGLTGLASASATTLTLQSPVAFDRSSVSGTVAGMPLTIHAATFDSVRRQSGASEGTAAIRVGGLFGDAKLSFSSYGLALMGSAGDRDHQFDGSGLNDLAIFSFGETVRITSALFNFVDSNDDVAIFVGDANGNFSSFTLFEIIKSATNNTGSVALNLVGRYFAFGALGNNDDWKMLAVNFEAAAVPLPGALPLFAAGLAIFGIRRARRVNA